MTGKGYYTQKELAEMFRVSQGTIIKWRELGFLEYFRPPGSNRVLYPIEAVERFKNEFPYRREVINTQRLSGRNGRRAALEKEWRI